MPPAATRPIVVAVAAIVAALLGGCTGERIYIQSDREWVQVTSALRLNAEQASDRVKRDPEFSTRGARDETTWLSVEPKDAILVGEWYSFLRYRKAESLLAGYYVHGNTGKVEYRSSWRAWTSATTFRRHRAHPSDWTSIEKISIPD
jgi:hypothetical protein